MTDKALTNAIRRRDHLATRINMHAQVLEGLRRELAEVDKFISDWRRFAGDAGLPDEPDPDNSGYTQGQLPVDTPENNQQTPSRPKNPSRVEVGRAAWKIINERNRPVPRADLFKELAARGVIIQGKDPEMILSTMMWRMPNEFVRLPKHGYWKRTEPYLPADYIPRQPNLEDDMEDEEGEAMVRNSILDPDSVSDA